MTWRDPAVERLIRQMGENDRLLRTHLAAIRDPVAEAMEAANAYVEKTQLLERQAQEFFRLEEYAKVANRLEKHAAEVRGVTRLVDGARLSMAATSAFDSIYADIERNARQWENMRRSLDETQLFYEQSRVAALFTTRVQEDLARLIRPAFEPLAGELGALTRAGELVLNELAATPLAVDRLSDWQIQSPTLLPYSAASSLLVLHAVEPTGPSRIEALDSLLDEVGDSIAARLVPISPALIAPYRGACAVLTAGGPDWRRHLGVSLRAVVEGLLDALAPEADLIKYFDDPDANRQDGRFTRRAQLVYIFRDVGIDGYVRMAENDIEMTLATFYPANAAVHELASDLTEQQGCVLLRRVQGCLATILATQER